MRNLRTVTKIYLVFLLLIFMLFGVGGVGLYFMRGIEGDVGTLVEVSSPLLRTSGELIDRIETVDGEIKGVLALTERRAIRQAARRIEVEEGEIREKIALLGRLAPRMMGELGLERLSALRREYFGKARQVVSAHLGRLDREAALLRMARACMVRKRELEKRIMALAAESETAVNEKEEVGRTLAQSGEATVEGMADLLAELFERDYAMLRGATRLRDYLRRMEGVTRDYLNGTGDQVLAAADGEFRKIAQKFRARLGNIERRARTDGEKAYMDRVFSAGGADRKSVV